MFNKPQFQPHFHVEAVEPSTVYLMSEQGHFALSGRLYVLLAPLLKGQHTVSEIVEQLKPHTSLLGVYHALTSLESQGYLTESVNTLPNQMTAFWSLQGIDPTLAVGKLQATKVSVAALGMVKTEPFISALKSLDISICDEGDFTVVVTDDYLQPELDAFNSQALRTQKPWMLVKPIGATIWVGPIFVPGQTGCWHCLAQRLRGHREVESVVGQQQGITTPFPTSKSVLPTHFQVGLNLAASEVAKWIAQGKHDQLEGKVLTLDLASLSMQQHTLVKRPQCPACGEKAAFEYYKPKPIVLQSQQKRFTADGGHRCFTPEQTFKKYEHHISPITGVVSALPKKESDSDLVHVYGAIHAKARKLDSLEGLRRSLRHNSAGKGKTDQQSKASGLCEAIERYSGVFTGAEIRIKGIYTQLESAAIHPNACLLFSPDQYQNRQTWNAQHGSFAWVPEPFDEEKEIEWTPVWSLTHQQFKYLPTAYCYYGYPFPDDHCFCHGDSNGNAAGNTLEEAILQGFMELVERDCVALWWYNRIKRPAVNLDSFDDPYLQALKDHYQAQQRDFWVLDLTSDFDIPCFAAISRRTQATTEEILLGFGTHFDVKVALLRAVTEMNQTLGIDLDQGKVTPDDPDWQQWLKQATLDNQPYLVGDRSTPLKVYADYPQRFHDDLRQDVLTCVEIAAQHGMETLVLDQTHPDIGLNVVKVIVPGMRHFWSRFAPGRLYEVPVKMGWLPAPLTEEELNPIPMFF
ncbi:TOMM precursor leader peptide-binding protein [Kovacikia minuta CCNUW1]|uniref:TOMM precursor leader peptide-binding protein n=1 Tax=Kovacikia minuta TaxID=2931930 RepID=UPI001CCBFD5E|nr:TOMM precursor leader peptide-binding protein [Kovacikia minuta]UBF28795.1 TOMM precursor leader peptide-binding protein [Kovacikia minuta CCNUW1]